MKSFKKRLFVSKFLNFPQIFAAMVMGQKDHAEKSQSKEEKNIFLAQSKTFFFFKFFLFLFKYYY